MYFSSSFLPEKREKIEGDLIMLLHLFSLHYSECKVKRDVFRTFLSSFIVSRYFRLFISSRSPFLKNTSPRQWCHRVDFDDFCQEEVVLNPVTTYHFHLQQFLMHVRLISSQPQFQRYYSSYHKRRCQQLLVQGDNPIVHQCQGLRIY